MGQITAAHAYPNNEVALIAWELDGMIEGCLGFDIVRIRADGSEPPKGLPAWVPFKGQANPKWQPQDTSVWPIQRLYWRDLTLRRHRDSLGEREVGFEVRYAVRPVGDWRAGLERVAPRQPKAYSGEVRPLGYLGPAVETNTIRIDLGYDGVRATFTNGILSGQWLRHAIESDGKAFNAKTISAEMANPKSKIRRYLTGDVLETVHLFLTDPKYRDGDVRLALYELSDEELQRLLVENKDRIEVILSNSSKKRGGTAWDDTNRAARRALHEAGVRIHDRMFNNNHIGHNKFAVWRKDGKAKAVMTGSTNWTPTGLCGQSNNALIAESGEIARAYDAYWQHLLEDRFPAPRPQTSPGRAAQCQGPEIRSADARPSSATLGDATVQVWFSPNTTATRKGKTAPPDLAALFKLMSVAKEAIFFLAFLPSRAGANSIISAAIEAATRSKTLVCAGAISDVTAMPGYVPPDKNGATAAEREGVKPYTYDRNGLHIVRATELKDPIGDFEKEILKTGNAVVHDKVVVIDPLSKDDCIVAMGSHNLGFKASYENDENMLIVRGAQALALAYAVHVIDVYDHYRFRAWQAKERDEGRSTFQGHIDGDDKWLRRLTRARRHNIDTYFAAGPPHESAERPGAVRFREP